MNRPAIPDPNGAAERPECGRMQLVADDLRKLLDLETDAARRATIIQAADAIELQLDWLLEQHRIIMELRA